MLEEDLCQLDRKPQRKINDIGKACGDFGFLVTRMDEGDAFGELALTDGASSGFRVCRPQRARPPPLLSLSW